MVPPESLDPQETYEAAVKGVEAFGLGKFGQRASGSRFNSQRH